MAKETAIFDEVEKHSKKKKLPNTKNQSEK